MDYRYRDDNEKALPSAEENTREMGGEEAASAQESEDYGAEYYALPASEGKRRRIWSVLSLCLAVLSVVLCPFYFVSLPLAVAALIASLLARHTFGFFDNPALAGLIVGVCGVVFGVFTMIGYNSGLFAAMFG